MSGSLNRAQLIGNLGKDPEVRTMQSGAKAVSLSIATSDSWRDDDGKRQERTEWHRVVIFNEKLGELAEKYLKKGAKVFVEGTLRTRKWEDKEGAERTTTEIQLSPYNGVLKFLDSKRDDDGDDAEAPGEALEPEAVETAASGRRQKKARA
jgi:single-strand DNA-binding protein